MNRIDTVDIFFLRRDSKVADLLEVPCNDCRATRPAARHCSARAFWGGSRHGA
jgi:hypothetical protein